MKRHSEDLKNNIKTLFSLGCFNQPETCMYCGSPVKLEVSRTKKIVGGSVKCYVSGRMRCCRKACRVVISLFENNIWSEIGDRKLFIYVVGGFLDRQSTVSVAASTGSREDSISNYFRIIKNTLHPEVEENLRRSCSAVKEKEFRLINPMSLPENTMSGALSRSRGWAGYLVSSKINQTKGSFFKW